MDKINQWPSQEQLQALLHYDPETGIFTWNNTEAKQNQPCAGSINKFGHRIIWLKGQRFFAHRLAFLCVYGKWPTFQMDHIDHNPDNNAIKNLREATHIENSRNRTRQKNNTSGIVGVSWSIKHQKWMAYIYVNTKRRYLGLFLSKEEAMAARQRAELRFGFHENHGKPQLPLNTRTSIA